MKTPPPRIEVEITSLADHRSLPNTVAARGNLTIWTKSGERRKWQNARMVCEAVWDAGFPCGYYSVYVEGEFKRRHLRGTRLIPPRWRQAARDAFYRAACEAETEQKRRHAEEIAAGTRFAPLPLHMIRPRGSGMELGGQL